MSSICQRLSKGRGNPLPESFFGTFVHNGNLCKKDGEGAMTQNGPVTVS